MPQHSKTTSGFKTNAQLDDEIMHRESMNGASGPTLPFINMSRWDHELPPRQEWGVHERIPIHQTALFTGEGAAGKSRVEIHGCVAHVLGKDWLKTLPEPGPAILVECEDDEAELHRRAAAVVKFYGSTFKEAIAGGLHLMSLAGKDAALATVAKTGKIEPTAIYHQLLQAAGDIRPKRISIASSATYAPTLFAQQEEAGKAVLSSKDFAKAMERLFATNKITNVDHGRPKAPRFHIEREE